MMHETDVAVIGAGPIGLEMAVALRREGIDYVQFEAGQIGSTMEWWAPGTRYFSSPERIEIAGVPLVTLNQDKATREEYLDYLRAVVGAHQLRVRTYTRVADAQRDGDGFVLRTVRSAGGVGGPHELAIDPVALAESPGPDEERWRARRIVLAIGDMHRPRLLGVPGEDLPHVSHFLADPHRYFGTRVLIVGGKNSAVEAAIRCFRVGADVTISYRGETFDRKRVKYWLLPEIEHLAAKERIRFLPRTVPVRFRPGGATLAPVSPETPAASDRTIDVEADHTLVLTGYIQDATLFDRLGVDREGEDQRPVHHERTMQTNVPGVYVAGTASAGSQRRARVFIETSHVHVPRIVAALSGRVANVKTPRFQMPES